MDRRWRWKLKVSLNLIQLQSTQYKDRQSYGWTLALPTYSVLKTYKIYNTQVVDVGVTNLIIVSLKFAKITIQRHTTCYGWTLALET